MAAGTRLAIQQKRLTGATLKQLAEEFGVSKPYVQRTCAGIVLNKFHGYRQEGLPHRILEHLHANGGELQYKSAAKMFGTSVKYMHDTVWKMVECGELESVHVIRLPKRGSCA